jgi:hypothetical protein
MPKMPCKKYLGGSEKRKKEMKQMRGRCQKISLSNEKM